MVGKIERILQRLGEIAEPEQMGLPGYRLHALSGDLRGFWSVTVNGNWRIIFRFAEGEARDVNLIDYHRGFVMPMFSPPHPGQSIRYDCLEPLKLTVTGAAKALGVTRQALNNVINGKAGISPEMAIRLDKAFGGGADVWLKMQASYDLAQAMRLSTDIKVRRLYPDAA